MSMYAKLTDIRFSKLESASRTFWRGEPAFCVVDDGKNLHFKYGKLEHGIPPGRYYPGLRKQQTILERIPDVSSLSNEAINDYDISEALHTLKQENPNASPQERDDFMRQFFFKNALNPIERRYFPLEEYHDEYKKALQELDTFLEHGSLGKTHVALFGGESGIGKSAFFEHITQQFIEHHQGVVIDVRTIYALHRLDAPDIRAILEHLGDRKLLITIHFDQDILLFSSLLVTLNALKYENFHHKIVVLIETTDIDDISEPELDSWPVFGLVYPIRTKGFRKSFNMDCYRFFAMADPSESDAEVLQSLPKQTPQTIKELVLLTLTQNLSLNQALKEIEKRNRLAQDLNFDSLNDLDFLFS